MSTSNARMKRLMVYSSLTIQKPPTHWKAELALEEDSLLLSSTSTKEAR